MNLISLMIGVLVSAILATLAMASQVPQMQRAQVRHVLADMQSVRNDLSTYLVACDLSPVMLSNGLSSLPHYTTTVCLPQAPINVQGGPLGGMVSQVSLNGLVLTATLGGAAMVGLRGQQLVLTARVVNSAVAWTCSGPAGMVPSAC